MDEREAILDALGRVRVASLAFSLVELGMIRDVWVQEARISLTVILTGEEGESKQQVEHAVREALKAWEHKEIHMRMREATAYEREDIAKKMQQPQTPRRAPQPQESKPGREPVEREGTMIAVASGKGGVGKTTVSVNLAVALARQQWRVGLIDADMYGFSVPEMMGITQRPRVVDGKVIPVEHLGVKVISMGFFVEDNAPVVWRGPMLGKMLRNFIHDIEWGVLDFLIVDLPPGTGDVALDIHQMMPRTQHLVVTTPHATASFVAARAGAMAVHTQHPLIGVVENMAWYEPTPSERIAVFGQGGGAKLAEVLDTVLLAQLPLVPNEEAVRFADKPENHAEDTVGEHGERDPIGCAIYAETSLMGTYFAALAHQVVQKTQQNNAQREEAP